MTDESNLRVKAYFTDSDGRQEIRRFGVPESVSTNYAYLKQRIQDVFSLGLKETTLSWQDSDGDTITICSDEELFEAISECITKEQQLLRIFVCLGRKLSKDLPKTEDNVHPGVVCDACDGPIAGSRFKCLSCPDFDLCSKCEAKGFHSDHKMMRIVKPSKGPKTEFWYDDSAAEDGAFHFGMKTDLGGAGASAGACAGGSTWTNNHPPQGRRCGRGRGRRAAGNNAWGWWPPHGYPHPPPPPPPPPQFFCSSSAGPTNQFPPHSKAASNNDNKQSSQSQQGQQQSQFQWGADFPWVQAGAFGGIHPPMPENMDPEADRAAQNAAQIAGKHLAGIMKDIWTAWSGVASTSGAGMPESGNEAAASMETDPPQKETWKTSSSSPGGNVKESEKKDDDVIVEEPKSSATSCPPRPNSESPEVMEISPPATEEDAHQDPSRMEPDEWTLLSRDTPSDSPKETRSEPPPTAEVIYPALNHFSVPISASISSAAKLPAESNKAQSDAKRPQASADPRHPNYDVQLALDQMQTMGYSNEGGWLTRLLEMKKGNINEVLDLLMPAKK